MVITKTKLTCTHCGHTEDVIECPVYKGGEGYVLSVECRDRYECWKRWDKNEK